MAEQPRAIGVISIHIGGYYFGAMLNGIHQAARGAGVPLFVIQQPVRELALPVFGADHVAGWIVLHPDEADRAGLGALCAAGKPVVIVPVPLAGAPLCTVVQVDNRGGMCDAVLHLIDHGHRRVAYVDQGPQLWSAQRYQGYRDALEARGIAYDPELAIDMGSSGLDDAKDQRARGQHAAQHLVAAGMPCTALACGTDTCALAAMEGLQAAGYRIPEDVAIVGFDDIVEAQYSSPPLSTVRTQFDVIGRAAADRLLAEVAAGQPARPQAISVPTTMLHRRSCGCTVLEELLAETPADASAGWREELTRKLAQVVRYPLPLDPATPPEHIWPGAATLVAALDDALGGRPPETAGVELAWQEAVAQTENLEALHFALTLLEDAAEERMAGTPDGAWRPAAVALLRRIRLELFRARLAYEATFKQILGAQVHSNYAVSTTLLSSDQADVQALNWLAHTPATWGCLALWDDGQGAGPQALTVVGRYQRHGAPDIVLGQRLQAGDFPPVGQLPEAIRRGQELLVITPIRTQQHNWGLLALSGWGDRLLLTGAGHLAVQAALLGATLSRNKALSMLIEQQSSIQAAYDRERMLSQTVRELGCPIIPLLPGVLLVPLIGAIDSHRAQQIIGGVLEAIEAQRAQTVFLDVTGVPLVDTQVASSLIYTSQAAVLLGARVAMVGIRPEVAQSIVSLGIDFSYIKMYSNLASAVSALQLRRPS